MFTYTYVSVYGYRMQMCVHIYPCKYMKIYKTYLFFKVIDILSFLPYACIHIPYD